MALGPLGLVVIVVAVFAFSMVVTNYSNISDSLQFEEMQGRLFGGNAERAIRERVDRVIRTTTTTIPKPTTTTTRQFPSCNSCPGGYVTLGNVCAPTCYHDDPPCVVTVIRCTRTS